jgi:cell division septation protein DedD
MKKFALYTFLSLSAATALVAQNGIKYEVEPVLGYNNFDSASKMGDAMLYGVRGTLYANDYYAYRLSYMRADNVDYEGSKTSKSKTDLQRIAGDIIISGEEELHVIPYLFVGLGYEDLSQETSNDVSQAYIDGGIGFKYNLYNNLYTNLELQALKKFDTDDIDYGVNLGFGYMFGQAPKRVYEQRGALDETPLSYQKELSSINDVESVTPVAVPQTYTTTTTAPVVVEQSVQPSGVNGRYTFNEDQSVVSSEAEIVQPQIQPQAVAYSEVYENAVVEDNQYYIQMAAWFNTTDDKLLNKIENKGFPFELRDVIRKDRAAQIVIVGPYEKVSDAKLALRDLKKIKRDAYITKVN